MLHQLLRDENGFIVSAELVIILTVAVLAMVVGLSEVAVAVTCELNDLSNAFGALDQSLGYTGFAGAGGPAGKSKSFIHGATWIDAIDDCDTNNVCCDVVVGASPTATTE